MTKKLCVYACGGTGINVGLQIERIVAGDMKSEDINTFADVVVYFIDTSESNIRTRKSTDNVYLYTDLDGSGSKRAKNASVISGLVRDVLVKYPPGDINVVINSMGGGSGSVIGPQIASELLHNDQLVVCMATQVVDNTIHLANTVKTFETYESIAQKREKVLPLVLCNNGEESEENVNRTFTNAVQMLSILFSGNNERQDTADLDHWINFEKVINYPTGAVLLDIVHDRNTIDDTHVICSVATITDSKAADTKFPKLVEYQTVGYINGGQREGDAVKVIHFALIDGPIQAAYKLRVAELADMEKILAARPKRKSIAVDTTDDSGMVL